MSAQSGGVSKESVDGNDGGNKREHGQKGKIGDTCRDRCDPMLGDVPIEDAGDLTPAALDVLLGGFCLRSLAALSAKPDREQSRGQCGSPPRLFSCTRRCIVRRRHRYRPKQLFGVTLGVFWDGLMRVWRPAFYA